MLKFAFSKRAEKKTRMKVIELSEEENTVLLFFSTLEITCNDENYKIKT